MLLKRLRLIWVARRRVLLLAIYSAILAAPAAAQDQRSVGQVVQQRGVVIAMHDTQLRALHLGAAVRRGDRVNTNETSKVVIRFSDGSRLSLGPQTEVEVTDYAPNTNNEPGVLTLIFGIIRTSLDSIWSDGFEVRTRAAVASVRATDWVTEGDQAKTSVFVVDGTVEVTSLSTEESVVLPPQHGTDVVSGHPSDPAVWGKSRIDDVLSRTSLQ